jgi:hypothetical protein
VAFLLSKCPAAVLAAGPCNSSSLVDWRRAGARQGEELGQLRPGGGQGQLRPGVQRPLPAGMEPTLVGKAVPLTMSAAATRTASFVPRIWGLRLHQRLPVEEAG